MTTTAENLLVRIAEKQAGRGKRKLRSDHGLAVLSVVIGKTLASLTQDETETRKILAALHERMLQAAGIDDSSGSQH